jgi:hypothetical protein
MSVTHTNNQAKIIYNHLKLIDFLFENNLGH